MSTRTIQEYARRQAHDEAVCQVRWALRTAREHDDAVAEDEAFQLAGERSRSRQYAAQNKAAARRQP